MARTIPLHWLRLMLMVLLGTILLPMATNAQHGYLRVCFLALNGHALTFDPQDATRIVLALAAGELSEEELTAWFSDHLA